jgi:7-cyano-7-deazaguanine synthase
MRVLLLLSGGLDSVVLLHHLQAMKHEVAALSARYGQRHVKEVRAARYWATARSVPHYFVDLPGVFSGSALTGDSPVPHGHYADESMRSTVVPNRNMVLLSIAVARALSEGFDGVAYAAHAGDAAVYPDCRPAFVEAMTAAIRLCDYRELRVLTPFLWYNKADIVSRGRALGVDFSHTWSCYEGGDRPCGKCGPCVARAELGV